MIEGYTVVIAHHIEVMLHIRKNQSADLNRTQVFRRRFPCDAITLQAGTQDTHVKDSIMGNKDTFAHYRLYLLPKLCKVRSVFNLFRIYARELRIEVVEVCFGIKFITCGSKLGNAIQTTSKISGAISNSMDGFDMVSLGLGMIDPNNPITELNNKMHQSDVYNKFQMGVSLVSSFSGAASQNMACFVAGTLILTTAGLLAIEKLRAGDKVLAADPESFEVGEKTILEAFERKVYKLVHLTINGEKIVTTDNHPFYVQGRGFIKAEGLFVGDKLISVDGKDLIVETHDIEQCEKPITVYNFKVEDYHTYFVGNCKIWVHNNDCVKKVESGEIELETKKQKGNYGEMKMDEHYDSKGFEKMHNGVESLDDKIHHGIDGVYKNKDPNGDPKFIIAEAKYGSSQLGNTKKSGPQMGDKWIKNNIGKIVDDPDDIIEGLATGDTVKELFRVNVSNDNGLVNVTTSVKSLK